MSGADAFAAVADRLDLFADRVRYERILACHDVADWCRKAGRLRKDWSKAAATWRRREKCPYCGEMPKFSVNAEGYLDLGCVNESHEPLNAKSCGGIIVDLVKEWDGVALPIRRRLEREAKNRRLLAVLNA